MTKSDVAELIPITGASLLAHGIVQQLYEFVGRTPELEFSPAIDSGVVKFEVSRDAVAEADFLDNDVVVTTQSASDNGSLSLSIDERGINHNEMGGSRDTIVDIIELASCGSAVDWNAR